MPTRAMILVLTSLASLTAYAEAQETLLGLSGGLGLGSATIGGTVSAWVSSPAGEFILRTAATSDFEVLTTPESTTDYALLYGRRRSSERSWLRAALGIGKVHRIERGPVSDCYFFICTYERIRSNGVGIAVQLDAVWAPSKFFGVGLTAVGNQNSLRPFGALTVSLHLGRIR